MNANQQGDNIGRIVLIGIVAFVALMVMIVFCLVLVLIVFVFTRTAQIRLENDSMGYSTFYVDGRDVCDAPSNTSCVIKVRVFRSHELSASTAYGNAYYPTSTVILNAKANEVYRFVSCGQMGTQGTNCGLFGIRTAEPTY
jgi:hypothetical protein